MSRLRFCLLLAVICSCSHLGSLAQVDEIITIPVDKKTTTTTHTPDTTTTTPDTTTPNTTTPDTTTPDTTTPDTTTSSKTTTTTPTTTSTTSTTTTTTAPPPTTTTPKPAPGPLPPPELGTWNFTDTKTNVTCIMTQFAAQLNVTYARAVDSALLSIVLNVPVTAKVIDGNCTGDQWLTLSWPSSNETIANNVTIIYHKNDTTKSYGVKSFNITLAPDNFVNASSGNPVELYHGPEWETPLATSYRCKVPSRLNMSSDAPNTVSQLTLTTLQEEAYRTSPGSGFSAARECGGGDVPDAVPIAVGCALGGLVVVVLVAYLVGRRRSAARGYLSM